MGCWLCVPLNYILLVMGGLRRRGSTAPFFHFCIIPFTELSELYSNTSTDIRGSPFKWDLKTQHKQNLHNIEEKSRNVVLMSCTSGYGTKTFQFLIQQDLCKCAKTLKLC